MAAVAEIKVSALRKLDAGLDLVNNWGATSATNNASNTTYATAGAVKKAYDLAAAALPLTGGGVVSGEVKFSDRIHVGEYYGQTNYLGANSITMGDGDTGFKWVSDGNIEFWSNSTLRGAWSASGVFEWVGGMTAYTMKTAGEIQTTSVNSYRQVYGNYGSFWRQDGSNLSLLLTASGDQYGTYTAARPLTVNLATGLCTINGNAATATKLATARQINGTNFDGSGNITTANWGTARTLTIGDAAKSVNGAGNVAWSLAEIGAARARGELASGATENITTAQFVQWLKDSGAFDERVWIARGSWDYANNKTITDTGCGNIHLAGCTIEVISSGEFAFTIRIITPTTTSYGGTTGAEFVYVNNGSAYLPGWRRIYTTAWKPTSADVGLGSVNNWAASGAVNLASDTTYATAGAVKKAYDLAAAALPKAGGVVTGVIQFTGASGGISIDSTSNVTGIFNGTGDGAAQDKTNIQIKSWYGIGISPTAGSSLAAGLNSLWISARTGDVWTIGELYAQTDKKVYHQGFKPTSGDVGLGNVSNWGATSAVNDASDTKYATAGAVKKAYDLAATKLAANANAVSATKLATARQINGTDFDGSGNITTANWGTARTLTIGNAGKSVNGGADVAWSLDEIGAVSKGGAQLTGGLTFSNANCELGWDFNTDYAKIGFKNAGDGDTDSYMWFKTGDNGNEYFKWQSVSGANTTDWMALKPTGLVVAAGVTAPTFTGALVGNASTATKLATGRTLTVGLTGKTFDGTANVSWTLAELGAVKDNAWYAQVKLGTWSAICELQVAGTLGGKAIVTVGHTRGNVVVNAMFLVSFGHSWQASITQLESHGYTQIKVRPAITDGNNIRLEILDDTLVAEPMGSVVTYTVRVDNLFGSLFPFTAFTASTGTPKVEVSTEWQAIKVNNNKVYHEGFKPTAADVLALPVKKPHLADWTSAPAMAGKQYAGGYQSPETGACYMSFGGGSNRMDIFVDGEIYVNEGRDKVYSPGNKPTAADVDALPSGGTAVAATKLATARQINGTNFDGSGNITTANWGTARTLTVGNAAKSVNGSGNVSWSLAEIGALSLKGGTIDGDLALAGGVRPVVPLPVNATDIGSVGIYLNSTTDAVGGYGEYSTVLGVAQASSTRHFQLALDSVGGFKVRVAHTSAGTPDGWRPWSTVYTDSNKPTSADVGLGNVQNWGATAALNDASNTTYATAGAVKKAYDVAAAAVPKAGGVVTGVIRFTGASGGISIHPTSDNATGIFNGTGDGAAQDKTNIQIKSWYGIGISPTAGSSLAAGLNSLWINARTGDVWTIGELYAQTDKKVYHQGFKPTSGDVGLGNVQNWGATAAVNDASDVKYATAGAVKKAYDLAAAALPSSQANVFKSSGTLADLNAAAGAKPGHFHIVPGAVGSPVSTIYGHGLVIGNGAAPGYDVWYQQLVFGHDNRIYTRRGVNSAATGPWSRFFTTDDKPTPADVSLGNVQNWGATAAINDASDTKYATAGAVKKAYDLAAAALPLTGGGVVSGEVKFSDRIHVGEYNGQTNKLGANSITMGDADTGFKWVSDGNIEFWSNNTRRGAWSASGVFEWVGGMTANTMKTAGEIQTTSVNSYRQVYGNYGSFWRQDGSNLYLLLTASGDQYGTYTAARPLTVNLATGLCTINGNAATATKLATARTLTLTGGVSGSVSFDGSGNISLTTTVGDDSHKHSIDYVTGLRSALNWKADCPGGSISFGGNSNAITTAQFIELLTSLGAFSSSGYWTARGSWSYAANQIITDTGLGRIHLAGAVVEVIGPSSAYTIRITTPTTTSAGLVAAEFIYVNNGSDYAPGWRRSFNTSNPPTAAQVGAMADSGSYGTVYMNNWFRSTGDTGWYNETYGGGIHMSDTVWVRTFGNKKFHIANGEGDALNVSGGIYAGGSGSFADVTIRSDRNLKSNFQAIEDGLGKVLQLTGQIYDKQLLGMAGVVGVKREAGLIAQDVEAVLPLGVHRHDDGYLSISQTGLNALFVEAIKGLADQIAQLRSAFIQEAA